MPKTKTPPANTAAALARYHHRLTPGLAVDVAPYHGEIVNIGRGKLVEVYETGNAVLVAFPGNVQAYVWDTQITAADPPTDREIRSTMRQVFGPLL